MLSHDPIDILLAHKVWADGEIFERCRTLSDEELNRRFEMGLGSVAATLLHNVAADRWWADRLADREPRKFLEPGDVEMTVALLEALATDAAADLRGIAAELRRSNRLTETLVSRQPPGRPFSRTTALMHACTHAIHHRAQLCNMLRHLRPDRPAPELDLTYWQVQTGG